MNRKLRRKQNNIGPAPGKGERPSVPVLFSTAFQHHRAGGLAQAERLYRRILALDPDHADSLYLLGLIAHQQGRNPEAVEHIAKAIAVNAGVAQYHYNLANALAAQGLLSQAAPWYRKALELKPDYAEAHNNLGVILRSQGRLEEAAACHGRAVQFKPDYVEAHNNLGIALKDLGRLDEAAACYRLALALKPDCAEAHNNLGVALKEQERLEEAEACYLRALEIKPDYAVAHNNLGITLRDQGRLDEAAASYQRALALKPDLAEAHNNLGILLKDLGRLSEALAAFDHAIAIKPRTASAWYNRADQKKFTSHDPDFGRMEALLGPDGLEHVSDRMLLHFALGKAYLDTGESEQAFGHLDAGNRIKRATFAYDAASTGILADNIIKTFTPELFEKLAKAGNDSPLPVFVVGLPRSGTTLVEQILDSHRLVHGAGELTTMQRIIDGAGDFPGFMEGLAPKDLAGLAEAYLAGSRPLAGGCRHVVDKLPANFLFAGLIRLMFPRARIIHCRRDPVDTCLSCYGKLFSNKQLFAYDLGELGRYCRDYQRLMAHWRQLLPASHFLEVDYEAVVGNVETQAKRMVDFLGLPWDEACLRFHENRRPVNTASSSQVRQPIYKTSVGRWKAHARHLKPLLDELGISITG